MRTTLLAGIAAGVTSTMALGALARLEGKSAVQPLNATSHWLHGERAARRRRADFSHTGVGLATHQAATFFWAALFAWWTGRRPRRPARVMRDALGMAVVAAIVDYTVTPKRFTPGWEFVLSVQAMAATYAAMAVGLAAGAIWAQSSRKSC